MSPSTSSLRAAAPIRPQRAKSTIARDDASSALCSNTAALSTAGTVFGMSTTVVMPPAAAAAVRDAKSSFSGKPGSRLWTWASTPPGSTSSPRASTSSAAGPAPGPTASTRPAETPTSASRRPSGMQTVPPRRTRSNLEIGLPEQRRERHAGPVQLLRSALLSIQHGDQSDHGRAGRSDLLDRTNRLAAGRDHVLDDRHPVSRLEHALDRPPGAVLLGLLPDEDERQVQLHRDRSAQEHRAQLGRRQPAGPRRH